MKINKSKKKTVRASVTNSKFDQRKIYLNIDYECPQFIPNVKCSNSDKSDIRRMYY